MDRITRVRIRNVRAIESIDLEVNRPLTVLIGENGSGKSTIVECLEVLRKSAESRFMEQLYSLHRGMPSLLRKSAPAMTLGVVVEDGEGDLPRIEYEFTVAPQAAGAVIRSEQLLVGPTAEDNASKVIDEAEKELVEKIATLKKQRRASRTNRNRVQAELQQLSKELEDRRQSRAALKGEPLAVIRRTPDLVEYFDRDAGNYVAASGGVRPDELLLTGFGKPPPHPCIDRLIHVLRGIEVHLGFETLAGWAARSHQRPVSIRGSSTLFPAGRLHLLGVNLASAWSELRSRDSAHWERTMDLVRLGLGERADSVVVTPDMGGGNVYLALRFTDVAEPVLASDLSDGQLAWLAFVAMARLNEGRSLLAVDEPELHLHPALLGRVVSLLSSLDGGAPVVLCTHADRVLELLDDPAEAVRVCSLDGDRAVVSRIDAAELPKWLEQFGDLGQLRASGYLSRVLVPAPSGEDEPSEGDG